MPTSTYRRGTANCSRMQLHSKRACDIQTLHPQPAVCGPSQFLVSAPTGRLVEDEVHKLQCDGKLLRVDGAMQQQQLRELGQAAAVALDALRPRAHARDVSTTIRHRAERYKGLHPASIRQNNLRHQYGRIIREKTAM